MPFFQIPRTVRAYLAIKKRTNWDKTKDHGVRNPPSYLFRGAYKCQTQDIHPFVSQFVDMEEASGLEIGIVS